MVNIKGNFREKEMTNRILPLIVIVTFFFSIRSAYSGVEPLGESKLDGTKWDGIRIHNFGEPRDEEVTIEFSGEWVVMYWNEPCGSGYGFIYNEIISIGDVIFFSLYYPTGMPFTFFGGWGMGVIGSHLDITTIIWSASFPLFFINRFLATPHLNSLGRSKGCD